MMLMIVVEIEGLITCNLFHKKWFLLNVRIMEGANICGEILNF